MFWQGLKAHPTAAEAPPGPGGGEQLWDCTARTAAADLAPQVAHSLAETVPGKVGSCLLGMGGVVARGRWMGSWASDPQAHFCVVISDLFSLEMLENPEEKEQWELHPQEDHVSPRRKQQCLTWGWWSVWTETGPTSEGFGGLSLRQESALEVLVPSLSACIQGPVSVVVCLLFWLSSYHILEKQANTGGSLPTRLMFGALIHTGANKPGS